MQQKWQEIVPNSLKLFKKQVCATEHTSKRVKQLMGLTEPYN